MDKIKWKIYQKEWETKNKKYRKKWMREYKIKNRTKIYKQRDEWLKKTGNKYSYYKPKSHTKNYKLNGTSGLGRKYELLALKLLNNAVDNNQTNFHGAYDIYWNNYKIDVKMRNLNKRNGWSFSTHKYGSSDYYLLFCVNKKLVEKILLIPKETFKTSLTVSKISKYDRYKLC